MAELPTQRDNLKIRRKYLSKEITESYFKEGLDKGNCYNANDNANFQFSRQHDHSPKVVRSWGIFHKFLLLSFILTIIFINVNLANCKTRLGTSIWQKKKIHYFVLQICQNKTYRIFSNKRLALDKRHPLISATSLGIYIEISAFSLISAAPLNAMFIRIVILLY